MRHPGSLSNNNSPVPGASLSNNNLALGVLSRLLRHNLAPGALSRLPRHNLAPGVLLHSNPIVGEPRILLSSNNLVVGEALLSSRPADGALKLLVSRGAAGVHQRSHSRRTPGAIL